MQTAKWNALTHEYAAIKASPFAAARSSYRKILTAYNAAPAVDADELDNLYLKALEALEAAPIAGLADAVAALRHCVSEPDNLAVRGILRRVIKALSH